MMRQQGFSLVELVITMALITIVASMGVSRFYDESAFAVRAFYDNTLNGLRYAQKLAIVSGCEVRVGLDGSSGFVLNQRASSCNSGAFTRNVMNPGTREVSYAEPLAPGASLSTSASLTTGGSSSLGSVVFNALGAAQLFDAGGTLIVNGQRAQITIGGDQIIVEAETGFSCGPVGVEGCS